MPDLSKGVLALRLYTLLLVLITMTGCASSVARSGTPRATEDAQTARAPAATTLAPDTDGDTIPDSVDACPEEAEDVDAFQDIDGCPDLDHDADGILDDADSCPATPEDLDGFEDGDGCPDLDNDHDAIADLEDRCPLAAEDFDGDQDEDGCPEQRRHPLDRSPALHIDQKTYFAPGGVDIRPREVAFLDALAKVLIENPDILELRLEGHTDAHGDTERNLEVSRQRAEAARSYLIARGVAPERLTLRALGDSEPHCDEVYRARETLTERECDAYNRRVEYKVVRRRLDNGTVFKQHP
jgi:outer membrane protein OmpA-like peptidoglycan-associated protein